jgi:hypothetical protein
MRSIPALDSVTTRFVATEWLDAEHVYVFTLYFTTVLEKILLNIRNRLSAQERYSGSEPLVHGGFFLVVSSGGRTDLRVSPTRHLPLPLSPPPILNDRDCPSLNQLAARININGSAPTSVSSNNGAAAAASSVLPRLAASVHRFYHFIVN